MRDISCCVAKNCSDEGSGNEKIVSPTKTPGHVSLQAHSTHVDSTLQYRSFLSDEIPRLYRQQGMAGQGEITERHRKRNNRRNY